VRRLFASILLKNTILLVPFLLASLLFLLREAIFGDFADLSHQISVVIGARHFVQINSHRTSPTTYYYITSQKYSVVIRARHFVQSNSHRTSPKIYFYCTSQKYNILQHVTLFKVILTVRHVQLIVTARHRNTTYYSCTSSIYDTCFMMPRCIHLFFYYTAINIHLIFHLLSLYVTFSFVLLM